MLWILVGISVVVGVLIGGYTLITAAALADRVMERLRLGD
jgi:hypothetical protein